MPSSIEAYGSIWPNWRHYRGISGTGLNDCMPHNLKLPGTVKAGNVMLTDIEKVGPLSGKP